MDFKSKLINIRIRDKKSDNQYSEIKDITNLYNLQDYVTIFIRLSYDNT